MYILKKLNEEKHVKTKELADRYIAEGYVLVSVPENNHEDVAGQEQEKKPRGRNTGNKPDEDPKG